MCTTCWDTAAQTASMGTTALAAGAAAVATTVHTWVQRAKPTDRTPSDDAPESHTSPLP